MKLNRTQLHELYHYMRLNRRDAKGLIKAAIRDDNPVIYFEHKFLYRRIKEEVPAEDCAVPIGKAIVRREGTDIAVITYGAMVWTALEAAKELEKEGLSLEVVDLRSLLPYDEELVLASVRKCSKVILLHEDTRTGGMAGELAALIAEKAFEDLDGPIVRVTSPDTPVPFSPPLEEYFLPNAKKVVEAARKLAEFWGTVTCPLSLVICPSPVGRGARLRSVARD